MNKKLCAVDTTIILSLEDRLRLEYHFVLVTVDFSNLNIKNSFNFDLMLIHSRVSNEILIQFSRCKYIGIRAHNTDYIDNNMANKLGMIVEGIPQAGGNAVAEHTFSLIFALTKQILHSNQNVVSGRWRENLTPNFELFGKKLGIIGYGAIGQIVARIGKSLGMTILISSRSYLMEEDRLPLEEVLVQSDILTLHASTKEGNEQLLNKERISMMKDGAIIINTARGKLVDYFALEAALQSGKIFGAGLDVFPEEPIRNKSICHLPNVVCTPHYAFNTDRTISIMNDHLINNAIQYNTNSCSDK
jgi:phosphoglycerate dehydrogenase-like enzyme